MSSNIRSRNPISSKPLGENRIETVPIYDANKRAKSKSSDVKFASPLHWIGFIILGIVVFLWTMRLDAYLPPARSSKEAGESRFSEERARRHFETLASFGPRPANSENTEIKARNYILDEIEGIRKRIVERGAYRLDVDVQKPSGCFPLHSDFMNCYRNVTNIVVRLGRKESSSESSSQHSLLLNCHFDSVPGAPGATDDAISCAVLLELIGVISRRSPQELPHELIFLFNGAEENYLQGAHGFITQHPWRHSIRAFVNVEGCGAGGREMVFQAGPGNSWLSHAYLNNAPFPHCNILAQELFAANLIPSDTDFRIFRDYGHVSGMDVAYINNGYVYHTEFDVPSLIPPGSTQRGGENLLATIRGILNSPCFTRPCPEQDVKLVFFDVLGLFVISYPLAYGTLMNYAVALLVLLRIARQFQLSMRGDSTSSYSIMDFVVGVGSHLIASVLMVATAFALIRFVNFVDMTMFWYSKQYMVLFVYVIPTLIVGMGFHLLVSSIYLRPKAMKSTDDPFRLERASFDSALGLLSMVLVFLTWKGIASAYYVFLHVLFPLARNALTWMYEKAARGKGNNATVLFLCHSLSLLPIMAVGSYGVLAVLQFFIPIMGRSGSTSNPEVSIAAVCVACSIVIALFMGGLIHVTKSFGEILRFLLVVSLLMIAIAALTTFSVPYQYDSMEPRLRRTKLQHVTRTIRNLNGTISSTENALFVTGMDYRGVRDLPEHSFLQSGRRPPCIPEDVFCALPYSRASDQSCPPENNLWISVPSAPHFSTPIQLKLIAREDVPGMMVKFSFSVTACDHAAFFITPLDGWVMHAWSFTNSVIPWEKTYFISADYVGRIQDLGPWEFWITVKPSTQQMMSNPTPDRSKLLLGIASHYIHGPDQYSDVTMGIIKAVRERRENPPTATLGYWKWMMTVDAFNSEYVAQYFA